MVEKKVIYDGEEVICKVDFQQYDNGSLGCVLFMNGKPYVITITMDSVMPILAFGNFIDIGNYGEGVLDFLKDNDFGILTEIVVKKGYCLYPMFVFDKRLVKEANPAVYNDYVKMYGKRFSIKDI